MPQPGLQLLLAFDLQGIEQGLETAVLLSPERAHHIGDQNAARLEPDIVILAAGFRNDLTRNPVGIGRVRDLVEGGPESAARIEGIEDDVAARGVVIVRDKLARCVVDQRGFAARFDAIEHLAQHRGLAAAGGTKEGKVPGLDPRRNRDRADLQGATAGQQTHLRRDLILARQTGTADHPVGQRILSLQGHGALDQPGRQQTQGAAQNRPDCEHHDGLG